jgi:hypothetical protein
MAVTEAVTGSDRIIYSEDGKSVSAGVASAKAIFGITVW